MSGLNFYKADHYTTLNLRQKALRNVGDITQNVLRAGEMVAKNIALTPGNLFKKMWSEDGSKWASMRDSNRTKRGDYRIGNNITVHKKAKTEYEGPLTRLAGERDVKKAMVRFQEIELIESIESNELIESNLIESSELSEPLRSEPPAKSKKPTKAEIKEFEARLAAKAADEALVESIEDIEFKPMN